MWIDNYLSESERIIWGEKLQWIGKILFLISILFFIMGISLLYYPDFFFGT